MQIRIEANVIFNNKFNFQGIYALKTIYPCMYTMHHIIYDDHIQLT